MNFKEAYERRAAETGEVIGRFLPQESGWQKTVTEAMNYSVLAGGKRLRPLLLQETFRLFGGTGSLAEPFMAAIEMIHTYSLVHDDLPCMDNDAYRRGRETTWKVYGEGMAVLAGDALLNYAFETALQAFPQAAAEGRMEAVGRALTILAQKAGIYGMIGGQTADIEGETLPPEQVTEELLLFIHEKKTAALIQSAMMIGAVLAGASEEEIGTIERIGYHIGVAFQIQDDILDITSSLEVLGKQTGSDEKNHKVTYVTLNGLEASRKEVQRMSEEALGALRAFPNRNLFLEELVEDLITREK